MKTSHYVLAIAATLCAHTAQAQQDQIIQFKRGHNAAVMVGEVKGYNKTYVFNARQGQKATVTLTQIGSNASPLSFSLYSYCGGAEFGQTLSIETTNWRGILPCTDQYSIDVSPDQNGIKNNYRLKYTLKVKIQ